MATFVTFTVSGSTYAVDADMVREVLQVESWTPPAQRVRGELVPTFDARAVLGSGPGPVEMGTAVVVLLTSRGPVAVAVDQLLAVTDLAPDSLVDAPASLPGRVRDVVVAVHLGRELVTVVDGGALVAAGV